MARFPEHFIQQVLQATDIIELVGQYVALKQKGRESVGLCPFHEDHKPSMFVSPAKQIYKCFSCGAGGNAIQFVMGFDKLTFPEAVRTLAERANIPLPREYDTSPPPAGGLSRNDLLQVVEWAAGFFHEQLASPAGRGAMEYVLERGMTEESIRQFGIGYAPDTWDSLLGAARRRRFSEEQLVAAGLVRRRDNSPGCYDYFRNRLMFPIHDVAGRVVAFGGRALAAEERAKYLNSPEGPLFEKSGMLFGLNLAREAIVRSKQAVVVEGYFDVLMPIQAGVGNVVATLGTALTERHVRILSRYAQETVLVFDADAAGAAAAERALQLFLAQRMHVRVATIPAGKDPCDYVLAEGGEAMKALIDSSPDALQYVWEQRYSAFQAAGGNPSQRNRLVEDFLALIVQSAAFGAIDGVRQQNLAQHIAHILNVPAIELQQKMRSMVRTVTRSAGPAPVAVAEADLHGLSGDPERLCLEVILDRPDLFDTAAERADPHEFHDAMLRVIAEKVWAMGLDGRLSLEDLMAAEDMASLAPTLAGMAMAAQRRGQHEATLAGALAAMHERKQADERRQISAQARNDPAALAELQDRLRDLQRGRPGTKRPRIQ